MTEILKINRRLNLVLEVTRPDNAVVHVHSVPISRETYDSHWLFLHKVVSRIYGQGFHAGAALRIGYRMMAALAKEMQIEQQINEGLFAEMWRLTNVVYYDNGGKKTAMFFDVMRNNTILDDEDIEEVQNAICFFTSASWVHGREEREGMYQLFREAGMPITSLDFTAWSNSFPMSTANENIGEKMKPEGSLVPS